MSFVSALVSLCLQQMNISPIELSKIAKKAWKVFREVTYILPLCLTLWSSPGLYTGTCLRVWEWTSRTEAVWEPLLSLPPAVPIFKPQLCRQVARYLALLQINMHCYRAAFRTIMLAALYRRDSFQSQNGTLKYLRIAVLITKIN
jgi:hypothetical protein